MPANDNAPVSKPPINASLLAVVLFTVCALIVRSFLQLRLQEGGMAYQTAKDLSWLAVPVITFTLMWPILRQNRAALASLFAPRRVTLRMLLAAIALGITLRLAVFAGLIVNASFQLFTPGDGLAIDPPLISLHCPPAPILLLSILVTAIMTPVVEEVVHRGFIAQQLLSRGRWVAIVLSAVLFGLAHNYQNFLAATLTGVFLALQFLNCRSLWPPILTHATYNAIVVFDWQCLNIMWNPVMRTTTTTITGSIAAATMFALLLLAAVLCRQSKLFR